MGLINQAATRIAAATRALVRGVGSAVAGKGLSDADFLSWWGKQYTVSYERTQVHKDMHRMDCDDGVITYALNTIASRALGLSEDPTIDSFTVLLQTEEQLDSSEVPEETLKRAQWEVKRLVARLGLQTDAWQIVRGFVKFGNVFREVLIDEAQKLIVALKPLPEQTIWPNKDARGNKLPGYIQRPENMPSGTSEIVFQEYEILQFPFGEIDGYLGTPLMKSSRKDWKRLHLALDYTGVARIIRAFVKLVHRVPVSSDWSTEQKKSAIEEYKRGMTKRPLFDSDTDSLTHEPWPQSVASDMFIAEDGTKRGGVEMLDPENAQLQNINDIMHFMDRIICATHVPKRYFPFDSGAPKLSEGGGQAEDKNFACLLVICQNILKQGLADLFDRQLVLAGINPAQIRYVFRMADINTTDQLRSAQTQLALAKVMDMMMARFPEMGERMDVMLREYSRMSDASMATLSDMEHTVPDDSEDEDVPKGKNGKKPRVQLPGTGVGPEVRSQV